MVGLDRAEAGGEVDIDIGTGVGLEIGQGQGGAVGVDGCDTAGAMGSGDEVTLVGSAGGCGVVIFATGDEEEDGQHKKPEPFSSRGLH